MVGKKIDILIDEAYEIAMSVSTIPSVRVEAMKAFAALYEAKIKRKD